MKITEPRNGNFADSETAIVVFNQFGATESQDNGRDAQVLADNFNLPVLAANRPGTGAVLPSRKLAHDLATPDGYLAHIAQIGREVDKQVENLGVTKLIVTGRSAGGLGALALARSETVSGLVAVFAGEPVGCETLPLNAGIKRYNDYRKQQQELLNTKSDDEIVKPLSPGLPPLAAAGRILSIPPAMFVDRFHNKRLFASDVATNYARYIAQSLHEIDTTLEFAEHSMVATPEVYVKDILPIARLRTEGAPFEVKQPNGTVHSSFDNRNYMNQVIEPTIRRTLAR